MTAHRDRSMTAQEFVLAYTDRSGECWLWTRACQPSGYGEAYWDGTVRYLHRISYEAFVGPIPDGLVIDHLCRVRRCCNPDHLEVVTQRENVMRSDNITALKARQTHCHRGHPLDGDNLRIIPATDKRAAHRQCRTCCHLRRSSRA